MGSLRLQEVRHRRPGRRSTARPTSWPRPTSSRQLLPGHRRGRSCMNDPADVDALLAQKLHQGREHDREKTWSPARPPRSARRSPCAASSATTPATAWWTATSTWAARWACWLQAEGDETDSVKEVLHDVALQIAAASPVAPEYVTRDQVDPAHLRAREGNPHRPGPQRGQAREASSRRWSRAASSSSTRKSA